MMVQYLTIKRANPGCILFYRMGDFYEMFFDDAVQAAAALDIALTKRGRHAGEEIPMCGVPVVQHEAYLARLIRQGFKVAVCEQLEDPAEAKKARRQIGRTTRRRASDHGRHDHRRQPARFADPQLSGGSGGSARRPWAGLA